MTNYYEEGRRRGAACGSWLVDGNTSEEMLRAIIAGYDEGDPQIFEMMPSPLSGEYAGGSIAEIFGLKIGQDWPADEDLEEYEMGFAEGFWERAIADCHGFLSVEEVQS